MADTRLKGFASLTLLLGALSTGIQAKAPVERQTVAAVSASGEPAVSVLTIREKHQWQENKVHSIWKVLHFTHPPLTDSDAQSILSPGDTQNVDPDSDASTYFLSGAPTLDPSPTGMLMAGSGGNHWPHCTVVLTSPDIVLTARHCVDTLPDSTDLKIYFPRGGMRDAAKHGVSVYCADDRDGCSYHSDDLAAIR